MTRASDLAPGFRHIRLILAREKDHPEGAPDAGYDILAPLTDDGHIDAASWKLHRDHCRVRHFTPDAEDRIGVLSRKPGGQWFVDYGEVGEPGYHFAEERFVVGEYVTLGEAPKRHTYRVVRVEKP